MIAVSYMTPSRLRCADFVSSRGERVELLMLIHMPTKGSEHQIDRHRRGAARTAGTAVRPNGALILVIACNYCSRATRQGVLLLSPRAVASINRADGRPESAHRTRIPAINMRQFRLYTWADRCGARVVSVGFAADAGHGF